MAAMQEIINSPEPFANDDIFNSDPENNNHDEINNNSNNVNAVVNSDSNIGNFNGFKIDVDAENNSNNNENNNNNNNFMPEVFLNHNMQNYQQQQQDSLYSEPATNRLVAEFFS